MDSDCATDHDVVRYFFVEFTRREPQNPQIRF